jgi:hypothetical protein
LVFFSRSWRSFDPMWISAFEKNTTHLYMGYKWHVNEMYIIYDIIKWDMNGIPWILYIYMYYIICMNIYVSYAYIYMSIYIIS